MAFGSFACIVYPAMPIPHNPTHNRGWLKADAVEKLLLKKTQISVESLASQNRVQATICPLGMVRVPPYLPRPLRQELFLQPRYAFRSSP